MHHAGIRTGVRVQIGAMLHFLSLVALKIMNWSLEQARIALRVEFLRTNVEMTAVFRRMAVVRSSNIAFRNHGQGQAARQQRREHYQSLHLFV